MVRLKIFEWIKCLLEDINIKFRETELVETFATESRVQGVNSRLITHARMYTEMNLKWPSIKPGTRNIPEHVGTFRNIPEHPGT